MCFRKKNKVAATVTANDREIINMNSKEAETLVILAGDNAELKKEVTELKETLKYLIPSDEAIVIDYDKKIRSLINDMRTALDKAEGDEQVKRHLTEIKLAIADRNAHL